MAAERRRVPKAVVCGPRLLLSASSAIAFSGLSTPFYAIGLGLRWNTCRITSRHTISARRSWKRGCAKSPRYVGMCRMKPSMWAADRLSLLDLSSCIRKCERKRGAFKIAFLSRPYPPVVVAPTAIYHTGADTARGRHGGQEGCSAPPHQAG